MVIYSENERMTLMFNMTKTLIVVYKDEMFVNQLKKLVNSKNTRGDNDEFGRGDTSIGIVAWSEKVWLAQKKAGNITDKVLFIGDIKGTDKLTPVIDVKLDEYGVKFGWAGPQAVLFTDPKVLSDQNEYNRFLEELDKLSIPESFKKSVENKTSASDESTGTVSENKIEDDLQYEESAAEKTKFSFLKKAKAVIEEKADGAGLVLKKFNEDAKEKTDELFRDRIFIKKQMLFYGIDKVYNDWLDTFMNIG